METTRVSRTVQTPTWLSAKLIENIIPHTCYVLRVFPSDQQTSILNFVNKQVILEKFNSSEEMIFLLLKIFYDFGKNSRVLVLCLITLACTVYSLLTLTRRNVFRNLWNNRSLMWQVMEVLHIHVEKLSLLAAEVGQISVFVQNQISFRKESIFI